MKLTTNENGIWCQPIDGTPYGINWIDIHSINGTITVYDKAPEIEIDFTSVHGGQVTISETWFGYNDVINEMAKRKMQVDSKWLESQRALKVDKSTIEIWHRTFN